MVSGINNKLKVLWFTNTPSLYKKNKYCDINLVHELNPLEWADCYRFFDFCLTDRFHSTIFSIKNKIPFMAVEYPSKYKGVNRGKIVDLLTKLDKMENHFFYDDNIDFKVQLGKIQQFFSFLVDFKIYTKLVIKTIFVKHYCDKN